MLPTVEYVLVFVCFSWFKCDSIQNSKKNLSHNFEYGRSYGKNGEA